METKYPALRVEGIPEAEPLFLFRAQDRLAPTALAAYRDALVSAERREFAAAVDDEIHRFVDWQVAHPDAVKLAD